MSNDSERIWSIEVEELRAEITRLQEQLEKTNHAIKDYLRILDNVASAGGDSCKFTPQDLSTLNHARKTMELLSALPEKKQ